MIITKLAALSLLGLAAYGPALEPGVSTMSLQQKNAAMEPLAHKTIICIAHSITEDQRFEVQSEISDLGEMIVDAVPYCLVPIHEMMGAYDRYFGEGTGEVFFRRPYLDTLPTVIYKLLAKTD